MDETAAVSKKIAIGVPNRNVELTRWVSCDPYPQVDSMHARTSGQS